MSYPRVVTPPPPPKRKIITTSDSYREMREITSILRGINGSIIRMKDGRWQITYTETDFISYETLQRRIAEARKKAKQNMVIVDTYIEKARRDIKMMRQNASMDAAKYERMYDDEIAKLEQLKNKALAEIKTAYGSFDCSDEVKNINAKIEELKRLKKEIRVELDRYNKRIDEYEKAVNNLEVAAEIPNVESKKPNDDFSVKTELDRAQEVTKKVEEKIKRGQAYAQQLDEIAKVVRSGDLEKYDVRFKDKVKQLDPFNPNSINEIKKLLDVVLEDEKFYKREKENEKNASNAEQKVLQDLEKLKQISKDIESIIAESYESKSLEDSKEANIVLLDQVNELVHSIKQLDFLSNRNDKRIKNILEIIESKKHNIGSSGFTGLLKGFIEELSKLAQQALIDNEKYHEFMQELEDYNDLIAIFASEDEEENLDQYAGYIFDPSRADEQIQDLKEANKFFRNSLADLQARAYVAGAVSVIEEERVFKKEASEEGMGVLFVDKDKMGVIYEIKTMDGGASVAARGVKLHNGKVLINPEKLKEVHQHCTWHEELEEKMKDAGFPPFDSTEMSEEEIAEYYKEENYYHCETYEDSYRYLKLFGLSDEEIFNIIGEGENHRREREQTVIEETTKEQTAEQKKELKEGE